MGIKTSSIAGFRGPLLGAGLVLACSGLAAFAPAAAAEVVATVTAQALGSEAGRVLDGVIQPLRQATVAAQVSGNVLVLAVKPGDRLKAGQLVARVDERDTQAAMLRSDGGVAQAEAELRNARTNADRSRELRNQGFLSQAALDIAETQYKAAQAVVQQAQAGRSQAALARGFTSVTAPFDAVVLATHVEAGDLATPGRPIATLYAPGALRAVVQVPASMAAMARGASLVQVELSDGRRIVPSVRSVLPSADPVSQTVEWRLELPPAPRASDDEVALMPGQSVRVYFSGPTTSSAAPAAAVRQALTVPAAAVLRRGELTAVYVVQDQRFVLRAVRTGADRGAAGVEVLAGLQPGERVAQDAVRAGLAGATPAPATK
jgi:RND family efflux transporter MFP subunit